MEDLRLVEVRERQGASMGVLGTIGMLVAASALLYIGFFVNSKFSNKVGDALNASSGGVINLSDTSTWTSDYTQYHSMKTDVNDAWDMGTLYIWAAVAIGILGLVFVLVGTLGRD